MLKPVSTADVASPEAPVIFNPLAPPPDDGLALVPRPGATASSASLVAAAYERRALQGGKAVTPEQLQSILYLVTFAKVEGLSNNALAERCGLSSATISHLFRATYGAELESVIQKINAFRELQEQRKNIALGEFVETSVSRRIFTMVNRSRVERAISIIYGDPQIGKTFALLEYLRRNGPGTRTFYVRMPAGGQLAAFTNRLARAVGEATSRGDHEERIFRHLGDGTVLIIDELTCCFHQSSRSRYSVRTRTLEFLRDLWDTTHCGLVLIGTNIFRDELEHGFFENMLEQTRRRAVKLQLPPTLPRRDLDAIAASYSLGPADDETHRLRGRVVQGDGLLAYVNYIRSAATYAQKKGEPLAWSHFTGAHDAFAKLSERGAA